MIARGWASVILGFLWIALALYIHFSSEPILADARNMQDNGFYYLGESQISASQFNEIKQYNNDEHGGIVEVISLNPITANYNFVSLTDYVFLTKDKLPDKSLILGTAYIFPIVMGAIGILQLFNGLISIGKRDEVINYK